MDVTEMPRDSQYLDCSHADSVFAPLLELHPTQQSAMFSRVTILASLPMCSHDGLRRLSAATTKKSLPQ
jgi:hypothetical protein